MRLDPKRDFMAPVPAEGVVVGEVVFLGGHWCTVLSVMPVEVKGERLVQFYGRNRAGRTISRYKFRPWEYVTILTNDRIPRT